MIGSGSAIRSPIAQRSRSDYFTLAADALHRHDGTRQGRLTTDVADRANKDAGLSNERRAESGKLRGESSELRESASSCRCSRGALCAPGFSLINHVATRRRRKYFRGAGESPCLPGASRNLLPSQSSLSRRWLRLVTLFSSRTGPESRISRLSHVFARKFLPSFRRPVASLLFSRIFTP